MIALVQQKKNSVTFCKTKTKFYLSLHYDNVNNCLYVNETEIYKAKVHDSICWYELCLRSISKDFTKNEQIQISLNGTVYDFSVDYSSVEK